MSFSKAKAAFKENGTKVLSKKDGHFWNTNAGLLNLTEALESELEDLHRKVRALEKEMQDLKRG